MKKYTWIFILLFSLKIDAQQVNPNNSNTQALEQLRMLQNRLDANNKNSLESGIQPTMVGATTQSPAAPSNTPTPQGADASSNSPLVPAASNARAALPVAPPVSSGNVLTSGDDALVDDLAYEQVEKQLFPMPEKEIVKLRDKYQKIELAKTTVPNSPPKPVATSQLVNLSPGSTPPVIRLAQGFVSSVVFLDSTGAPWPISAYDLGDPSAFNIVWDKTSNTLMIQASKLYNYGNLAVRLEGLNTPVMLTLIPGQKVVDYRVDMRVQGFGPNAQIAVMGDNLPPSANRLLLHILDGVPPNGSSRLTVSGGDARAWIFKNKMYVRTNLTILSPAWLATMTSADGMHAYEMQKSPVILVSWHGKVMQLKVEGL